jgi:hypothetical protein
MWARLTVVFKQPMQALISIWMKNRNKLMELEIADRRSFTSNLYGYLGEGVRVSSVDLILPIVTPF